MTHPPVTQACPNCQRVHDVSVFVSGQKLTCQCGIRFEVQRRDVSNPKVRLSQLQTKHTPTVNERSHPSPRTDEENSGLELTLTPSPKSAGATVAADVAAPPVPDVPGYELIVLLGRGGMGEVWKAKQLSLGRLVALKFLPSKFSGDAEFVARFEKEASALASLSHPQVVQIIDKGQVGQTYFFAMELINGISLREMLQNRSLSLKDALRIGAQIARGIDYAHEQNVIHRDLKPDNVLVDPRGHVKIADFGLAGMKGNEKNIALTATSVAMGTVNYMAPEQRRDAKHVDHRADLYSLGVMLYEMLTQELPIGRFRMPAELIAGLDPSVDALIGQLLENEPDARPKRAMDAALVLEAAVMHTASPTPFFDKKSNSKLSPAPSLVQPAHSGWKVAAVVFGALLATSVAVKMWPVGASQTLDGLPRGPAWYEDTEDELFSNLTVTDDGTQFDFSPSIPDAGEEFNVHSGYWTFDNGTLWAMQYGDLTDHSDSSAALIPRAYVAHRYFSADDFEAEVDMDLSPLPDEFPQIGNDAQQFGELALRIKDLQVSVFAVPKDGMRLTWRYFTPDGQEVVGGSDQEVKDMVQDEMRVPAGKFRVKLSMHRQKNGTTMIEVFVNQTRLTRKTLSGLSGRVGKVAVGCRNLSCRFDDLVVRGRPMPQPKRQ